MAQPQVAWMIEQPVPEYAAKIARVHGESFKTAYLRPGDEDHNAKVIAEATDFVTSERLEKRMELIKASMDNPQKEFFQIAMSDESEVLGFIYGFKAEEKQEILALYVDEQYFGGGVGRALVDAFIEWSDKDRPIELGVVKDNERAKRFYSKMGFRGLNDDRESHYDFLPETTMVRDQEEGSHEV